MSYYLGIDIGTTGTKTLLIDAAGQVLAEANAGYPMHHPKPCWSEQDPEDWWQATVKTIRQVVQKAKLKPADVQAIGLSGQMHGSVFLDKNNKVLRPALLWNDQRTAAECDEITTRAGGRKALIRMVANPALTGFPAPKILWLRNHEPKKFAKLTKVLLPKDEIRRRLTGEFATEVSDASGMLLLDVVRRCWSQQSAEQTRPRQRSVAARRRERRSHRHAHRRGRQAARPDDGVQGRRRRGRLRRRCGRQRHRPRRRAVHLDRHLGRHVRPQRHAAVRRTGRLHTFCHAVRGKWHMMGVSLPAAVRCSGGREHHSRRCRSRLRGGGFRKRLPDSDRGSQGGGRRQRITAVLAVPRRRADAACRSDRAGAFVGLNLTHTRGHLARAVMEGVTFALRDSLEIIEQLGVPVKQIRAGGGGSRNPIWRQMQADIFGRKITGAEGRTGAGLRRGVVGSCR